MFDKDFDKEISEYKKRIAELEEMKVAAARRDEGFEKFQASIISVFEEYGLSEYDLFLMKSVKISEWLQHLGQAEEKPAVFEELKAYFGKLYAKEQGKAEKAKPEKKSRKKGPDFKLAIGIYTNPFTNETVEKKRRNPKQLDEWLEEFGGEEVASWIQE